MLIEQTDFGLTRSGEHASLFSIRNSRGMCAVVTNYGAILVRLLVPCPDGVARDVVTGYDTLPGYEAGGFFGATVGRHANRISGAAFTLDGVEYSLADNDNGCNLHSDFKTGFHKQLWNTELLPDGVRFFRTSPAGEAGFPGNLEISVFYTLDDENGLHIRYEGVSDRKTLINLTNHSFFNLSASLTIRSRWTVTAFWRSPPGVSPRDGFSPWTEPRWTSAPAGASGMRLTQIGISFVLPRGTTTVSSPVRTPET